MCRRKRSVRDRFYEKFKADHRSGCWEWTGAKTKHGYGYFFGTRSRPEVAHRISYEIHKGPIPKGLHVMHDCDNKSCVNPDHLRVGTRSENIRAAVMRGLIGIGAETVRAIRSSKRTNQEIADEFGINRFMVTSIRRKDSYWYV